MSGRVIALGLLAIAVAGSATACGDGCFFTLPVYEVASEQKPAQSAQQAALFWIGGTETLHLRSNYTGPSSDFAWVIPVPARPTVTQSSWTAFEAAEQATRPVVIVHYGEEQHGGLGLGCSSGGSATDVDARLQSRGVVVLDSLNIMQFHVDILVATEGGGLVQWLRENNYAVPEKAADVPGRIHPSKFLLCGR